MRKPLLSALSLLLLSACAQGYISGTEKTPAMYPSGLPEITALHITDNVQTSAGHSAAETKHCKAFKITQAQAVAYFQTARLISASETTHTVDTSLCHAQGDMNLAFEGPARWTINEHGSSTLTKKNGTELKLFCPDCILGNAP
jgi:hypothetical protein